MDTPPLKGIRVLDLSRLFPGPFATEMLGALGADVVKIEPPGEGDYMRSFEPLVGGRSVFFQNLNRYKRSLCLDLKKPEGRDLLKKLASKADVLVESFRPGVMDRLGVGYEALKELNPGLIYTTISGYGNEGPMAPYAGHDLNYLALSGVLSQLTDRAGEPIVPKVQLADVGGGALHAVIGTLAALLGRSATGQGRRVDVSMTDVLASWLVCPWSDHQAGLVTGREIGLLTGRYPCYAVYRAGDGRYLAVAALEEKFWKSLCTRLEVPELIPLQFAEGEAGKQVFDRLASIFGTGGRDHWAAKLLDADCCVTPILAMDELAKSPHWVARGLVQKDAPGALPPGALAPALTLGASVPPRTPPELGEDTRAILGEFGFAGEEVERLVECGAVSG